MLLAENLICSILPDFTMVGSIGLRLLYTGIVLPTCVPIDWVTSRKEFGRPNPFRTAKFASCRGAGGVAMRNLKSRTFPNLVSLERPPGAFPDHRGFPNCFCDVITLIAWRPLTSASPP